MSFIFSTLILVLTLYAAMAGSIEVGYRFGRRYITKHPDAKAEALSTIDSAVFGILGLILAFTFTGL